MTRKSLETIRCELQAIRTVGELLDYVQLSWLERFSAFVVCWWLVSPLLVLLRAVLIRGSDTDINQIVLGVFWLTLLRQTGLLGGIVALLALAKSLRSRKREAVPSGLWLKSRMVPLFLVLMLCWSALSCLFSDNQSLSFWGDAYRRDGLSSYLLYAGLFAAAWQVRRHSLVQTLLHVYAGTATVLAVLVLLNIPAVNQLFQIRPHMAVFYNINHYGYYLSLSVMLGLVMWLQAPAWLRRDTSGLVQADHLLSGGRPGQPVKTGQWAAGMLWLAVFTIQSAALVLNGSLGPYLAVVAGLAVMLFLLLRTHPAALSRFYLAAIVFAGVSIAVNALTGQLARDLARLAADTGQIVQQPDQAGGAGSGRWILWVNGLRFALQKPVFGYGPDNLGQAYRDLGITIDRPHQEWIQFAASLGWPALVFYLAALAAYLRQLFRRMADAGLHRLGLAGMVAAYLVSSLFGNTMFYTTPFFMVIWGLSAASLSDPG